MVAVAAPAAHLQASEADALVAAVMVAVATEVAVTVATVAPSCWRAMMRSIP